MELKRYENAGAVFSEAGPLMFEPSSQLVLDEEHNFIFAGPFSLLIKIQVESATGTYSCSTFHGEGYFDTFWNMKVSQNRGNQYLDFNIYKEDSPIATDRISIPTLEPHKFYYFAVTSDGSTITYFMDREVIHTSGYTPDASAMQTENTKINGSMAVNTPNFILTDLAIFDFCLSTEQVTCDLVKPKKLKWYKRLWLKILKFLGLK